MREASPLHRGLGTPDGAAVIVSNVVGTGIFLTPTLIAGLVPSPGIFLGIWALGGALALIGALAYAELSTMLPEAGGEYVYIREAFGPLAGFLSGWTSLIAGFSGAVAAAAVGFAIYLDRLVAGAGSTRPLLELPLGVAGHALTVTPRSLVAVGLVAVFTTIHVSGLKPGRVAQQALGGLTVLLVAGLVVAGFLLAGTPPPGTPGPAGGGSDGVGDALTGLLLVLFTYSGWNAATYVAGEVRDPGRRLPRALLLGTGTVTALYLGLNLLYVRVLGIGGIAAAEATGDRLAELLWGAAGSALLTSLILLVLAASVSAMVMTGPRVYYAMARDRCLPRAFGSVPDGGVPVFSILAQSGWSTVLILTGGFEALLTYTGFAVVLFSGVAVASLLVLRRRRPDAARPFRTPGYPVLPVLFLVVSLAVLVQAVVGAPEPSLAGLVLILLGVPVFWWARRRGGPAAS